MNVLTCADDSATRYMLSIALGKLGVECVEASNGLQVLEKLEQQHIDVVILEARIPVMDGLETIEVIRESPRFAELPIMVFIADRDEASVTRFVKLRVKEILIKPVTSDGFVERFECLIKGLAATPHARDPQATGHAQLGQGGFALIVDGDTQYREYFRKVAGSRFKHLSEASTGAEGLEACLKSPPDIVFLGTDLGIVGAKRLAQRLRSIKAKTIRIFAIPRKSEVGRMRASRAFDEVIVRTYVPSLFEKEMEKLFQAMTAFIHFRELVPDVQTRVVSSVEQVFGMMLHTDVEPIAARTFGGEPRALASVTLTTEALIATVRIRFGMTAGRALAGAFLETDGADLSDEDVVSTAGELLNMLIGRLNAGFQERKVEGTIGLPVLETEADGAQIVPIPQDHGVDVHFGETDGPVSFQVVLTVDYLATTESGVSVDEESGVTMIRSDA